MHTGADGDATNRLRARRYERALWTSFDRFSRYTAIADAVRANLGEGRHSVLDIGDASGYLRVFDEGLEVASLDVARTDEALPGAVRLQGSGIALPFADDAFDVVVSSDTLEHVETAMRPRFLAEVSRVARRLTVIAAPFDTGGVSAAEDLVRRYALLTLGEPQVQLEEHRERGLPDLDATCDTLTATGAMLDVRGNGNLDDWVCMMLLKHQLMARPALDPLNAAYDIAYNGMFSSRDRVPPYYRHIIVASTERRPTSPPAVPDPPATSPMVTAFLAAATTEVVRQDLAPRLDHQAQRMDALERSLDVASTDLRRLSEAITAAVPHLTSVEPFHRSSLWGAASRLKQAVVRFWR